MAFAFPSLARAAAIGRFFAALRRNERGAVAPMVALLGVSLVGAAGMALDAGLYYAGNRELRVATEAAALAAAMKPAEAEARARIYLERNGFDPSTLQIEATGGRYAADGRPGVTPEQRFVPVAACPDDQLVCNAVRLHVTKPSKQYLSRLLGPINPIPELAATATAARIDEAGVGVTSDILSDVLFGALDPVTDPLVTTVERLLSSLLGTPIALGRTNVRDLMRGNVDAGLFFDKLAAKEGFQGTYGELVNNSHGLKDITEAAAAAASTPAAQSALSVLAGQVSNGYSVPFTGLFDLGIWQDMPVSEADAQPALRAGMNAYQLITYAVQAGPMAIDLSKATGLLVTDSRVKIGLTSSGAGDRPRFSFGQADETSVSTSALRIQILVDLPLEIPLIASVKVHLPIILDVGAAKAEVSAIDCSNTSEQSDDTTVSILATTGTVNAYIGDTSFDPMAKSLPPLDAGSFQQATIADITLLDLLGGGLGAEVKGKATAQPVTGQSTPLTFGPGVGGPLKPGKPQPVGNPVALGQTVSSLTTSLLGSSGLDIQLKLLGNTLCLPIVCPAAQAAALPLVRDTILPALIAPVTNLLGLIVDPLLTNVLAALGIQLGSATVWVTGARCGVPVLV